MSAAPLKVLVVDDEPPIRKLLRLGLSTQGYDILDAPSGKAALELIGQKPDLVILDLGLPDLTGIDVVHGLRGWSAVPIIVLSARDAEQTKIAALDAGADDYITKPFALEELMARVEAVIRRHRGHGGSRLVVGDVSLDLSQGTAERGGHQLTLTGFEFRILAALMRNRGRLVTYAQLAEAVWSADAGPGSNSLEVHVSRIRQKLEAHGEPRLIHTVRGIGYRFNPEG